MTKSLLEIKLRDHTSMTFIFYDLGILF